MFNNPFVTRENIRIDQNCIFCGQFTNELQKHEFDKSWRSKDKYHSESLTVPFPAHKKCLTRAKWIDRITMVVIVFGVVYLFGLIAQALTPEPVAQISYGAQPTSSADSISCAVGMITTFGIIASLVAYTRYWKKRWTKVIQHYYETHRF